MNPEEILNKFGLKYEDLNTVEKETYNSMISGIKQSSLNSEKLKEYVSRMRYAVEEELVNEPEHIRIFIFKFENRKQIYLKARLRNYMLLEAFLESPKRAKEALERALAGIVPKGR